MACSAMFLFFVGVAIWAFLPSQKHARDDASMIPFRNENGAPNGHTDTSKAVPFAGDLKGQRDA